MHKFAPHYLPMLHVRVHCTIDVSIKRYIGLKCSTDKNAPKMASYTINTLSLKINSELC